MDAIARPKRGPLALAVQHLNVTASQSQIVMTSMLFDYANLEQIRATRHDVRQVGHVNTWLDFRDPGKNDR